MLGRLTWGSSNYISECWYWPKIDAHANDDMQGGILEPGATTGNLCSFVLFDWLDIPERETATSCNFNDEHSKAFQFKRLCWLSTRPGQLWFWVPSMLRKRVSRMMCRPYSSTLPLKQAISRQFNFEKQDWVSSISTGQAVLEARWRHCTKWHVNFE